ncbi:MAG: peptidoglycan DD-metalloendopeptidase family protein [Bacteroidetes bacterium]|nr:peptidoglycan DD-metalloendopeptidase family protein [Bacteroidota bacterium]HET6243052.1 M23 family metallopeptidase [Bacteroidia bacterium]
MKLSILISFLLFCFSVNAGNPSVSYTCIYNNNNKNTSTEKTKDKKNNENKDHGEDEDENDEDEEALDSDSISLKINSTFCQNDFSSMNIPAHDLYGGWDNYVIHPYKFDLTKKTDTTFVFLQDENKCDYHHPISGYVTSNFGTRGSRFHYGIDIKLQIGDSVYNAFEGTVRIAKKSASYGNVVVVRHNNGLETLYAHLDKISVELGDVIGSGDLIGFGGNTGRSTGSHLHFEVRFQGEAINPNDIICFENNRLKMDTLAINKHLFDYVVNARAVKYYSVRKGDTLSGIAKKHRTTVSKLCKLNKFKSTTVLRVGKKIRYA